MNLIYIRVCPVDHCITVLRASSGITKTNPLAQVFPYIFFFFFFFFFFLVLVLQLFQDYLTNFESIINQRRQKLEYLEKNHLTFRCRTLRLTCGLSEARNKGVRAND